MNTAVVSEYSIKKKLEEKPKEESKEEISNTSINLPDNHFSETDLQTEWSKFLKDLSVNNPIVFNAINTFILKKINEHEIEVSYSSKSAKKEFESIKADFFNHFMHKVNNFKIEIIYKDNPNLKKKVLTKRETFNKLVEINPILKDLDDLMKFDFS